MKMVTNKKEYMREWRKNNKDKIKGYSKKWRENHLEEEKIRQREYYQKNKRKILERTKKHYNKNKKRYKKIRSKWWMENRDNLKEKRRENQKKYAPTLSKRKKEDPKLRKGFSVRVSSARKYKPLKCCLCGKILRIPEKIEAEIDELNNISFSLECECGKLVIIKCDTLVVGERN